MDKVVFSVKHNTYIKNENEKKIGDNCNWIAYTLLHQYNKKRLCVQCRTLYLLTQRKTIIEVLNSSLIPRFSSCTYVPVQTSLARGSSHRYCNSGRRVTAVGWRLTQTSDAQRSTSGFSTSATQNPTKSSTIEKNVYRLQF